MRFKNRFKLNRHVVSLPESENLSIRKIQYVIFALFPIRIVHEFKTFARALEGQFIGHLVKGDLVFFCMWLLHFTSNNMWNGLIYVHDLHVRMYVFNQPITRSYDYWRCCCWVDDKKKYLTLYSFPIFI